MTSSAWIKWWGYPLLLFTNNASSASFTTRQKFHMRLGGERERRELRIGADEENRKKRGWLDDDGISLSLPRNNQQNAGMHYKRQRLPKQKERKISETSRTGNVCLCECVCGKEGLIVFLSLSLSFYFMFSNCWIVSKAIFNTWNVNGEMKWEEEKVWSDDGDERERKRRKDVQTQTGSLICLSIFTIHPFRCLLILCSVCLTYTHSFLDRNRNGYKRMMKKKTKNRNERRLKNKMTSVLLPES